VDGKKELVGVCMDRGLATSEQHDAASQAASEAEEKSSAAASFAAGDQTVWADASGFVSAVCGGTALYSSFVLFSAFSGIVGLFNSILAF
jgi:hypothetical protein